VRQRVLAYVTRERHGRLELLVFEHRDHPGAGTQVPAGRIDPGESLEEGLLRELHEEAGLDRVEILRELPILGDHVVQGSGDDAGLVFRYRWAGVDTEITLWDGDPTYAQLR